MKNRKTLCLIISLVLVLGVALPGTLATAISTDDTNSTFSVGTDENKLQNSDTPLDDVNTDTSLAPSEGNTEIPDDTPETTEAVPETTEGTVETSEPTEPVQETNHIDTCNEDCTDESCECGCNLFDRLMACTTIEEMDAIFASTEDTLFDALTDEQWAQIDAHYCAIEPPPAPAIILEVSDPPVASEIYSETVNYSNVAPFVGDAG